MNAIENRADDAIENRPIFSLLEDPELRELAAGLGNRYEIEQRPDGRVVFTPKLTWAAAQHRLGLHDAPRGEFEDHFADLPAGPF